MLQCVKTVVGQLRGIRMTVNAEDAAIMFWIILHGLRNARGLCHSEKTNPVPCAFYMSACALVEQSRNSVFQVVTRWRRPSRYLGGSFDQSFRERRRKSVGWNPNRS